MASIKLVMKRVVAELIRIGLILCLPVVMLVALISGLVTKPMTRNPRAVAELLRRRLAGEQARGEWDEFVCLRIADSRLEAVRRGCAAIEEAESSQAPPAYLTETGLDRLRQLLHEVEGVEQADAADERANAGTPPARS
jgi:hypothetical protein